MNTGEIILYQPDSTVQLEVRIDANTVWLTQAQMALLFNVDRTVIVKHIGNIYKTFELDEISTCVKFAQVRSEGKRNVIREQKYYNLDMIISVGYRVNSINATKFRQWATQTLKSYLLHGYAVTQRIERLEQKVEEHDQQIGFFVHASLPPVEGVFYDGQIFDAYVFAADLIKSAKTSIVLIDNYVDESVLTLLSKRTEGVSARVITRRVSEALRLDVEKHNQQYAPIMIEENPRYHDRFLIIDDTVYHLGASLKDLGKKLFAFSRMNATAEAILV
jgi:hypothetical protein